MHESKSAVKVRRKLDQSILTWEISFPPRKVTRTWYSRFTESGRIDKGNVHRERPPVGHQQHLPRKSFNPDTPRSTTGPHMQDISTQGCKKEDQTLSLQDPDCAISRRPWLWEAWIIHVEDIVCHVVIGNREHNSTVMYWIFHGLFPIFYLLCGTNHRSK